MNATLLVFAKAPVAGRAKTRLIPALGLDGAAALQAALVDDTLARARAAAPRALQLWGSAETEDPALADAARRHGASLFAQPAGDLGARMRAALARATADGPPAIVIGTDAPALDADAIASAGALLAGHDAVLGPADDGGYVLLGLHRAEAALFEGIDWGGGGVLAQTRSRLQRLGWHWAELRSRWDLDRPEDLGRLRQLGPQWQRFLSERGHG